MPAEVLASVPAPVQALAANRVSVLARLLRRFTDLRFHIVVRLRLFLSEIPVTSLRSARGFSTSAATLGLPQDRHSDKAKSQEAPTSLHGTLATRLRRGRELRAPRRGDRSQAVGARRTTPEAGDQ